MFSVKDTSLKTRSAVAARLWPDGLKILDRAFAEITGIPASFAPLWRQYALALAMFVAVSFLNFWLNRWLGYQAIALVYLLAVVLLSLVVSQGPVFFGTLLTAAGWNYFFAPPVFAFNISDPYDNMMLVTYFVVTLTVGQLTARLRVQRQAELKAKLAAESERLGRTLLNSVSHELRTPLAAATSAAHTLRSMGALTSQQENLVTEIESANERLNRLVHSLLSAARIQAGQVRPKLDWCDVSDLVRVTLRGIKSQIYSHRIRTLISPRLPLVRADFILTEQAIANLVLNAVNHTLPGTAVEISALIENGTLALSVEDSGPGIPVDELDSVFDPFHRGRAAKTGGVGLGLAIVKGFIEAQGGHVAAANRKGGGAIFTIYLPASDTPKLPKEIL